MFSEGGFEGVGLIDGALGGVEVRVLRERELKLEIERCCVYYCTLVIVYDSNLYVENFWHVD